MARQLEVWLHRDHVGTLSQIDGRLSFSYASGVTSPLSQSLPIQSTPFYDHLTRPYFAGLLPEAKVRKQIAKTLQISAQNDYALLDSLGGECAGAVTLLGAGQIPAEPGETAQTGVCANVRWLNPLQLLDVLSEMPLRPMLAGDDGLRLSLAGAQDKLPVVVGADGLGVGLPLHGFASTHILKPAIAGVDGSVFNEAFCMALAAAFGLDVAHAHIHSVGDGPTQRHSLLVQRYDRQADETGLTQRHHTISRSVHRIHQEDFCQALGVVSENKYQSEGGPGLAQAFALLRSATRPSAPQTLKLLDAVVFNALSGNHDAHGKNFSLLYTPAGIVLTPLYDLLCTAVYPSLTTKMAMKIGSKYKFSEVMPRHWEQFALDAQLSPAQVKKRVIDIAKGLPEVARTTQGKFQRDGHDHAIIQSITHLIDQRCALTLQRLNPSAINAVAVASAQSSRMTKAAK